MQSVKPPVDEPTSMHTLPSSVTSKFSIAFSNLSPPRLTYLSVLPLTSICASSGNVEPALSSFCPSTYTQPDIITAFAFSLETASPLFTRRTSNLSFAISFSSIYLYKMITLCLPHLLRQFLLLF